MRTLAASSQHTFTLFLLGARDDDQQYTINSLARIRSVSLVASKNSHLISSYRKLRVVPSPLTVTAFRCTLSLAIHSHHLPLRVLLNFRHDESIQSKMTPESLRPVGLRTASWRPHSKMEDFHRNATILTAICHVMAVLRYRRRKWHTIREILYVSLILVERRDFYTRVALLSSNSYLFNT